MQRNRPGAIKAIADAARDEVRVLRTARITRWHDDGRVDIQPDVAERVIEAGSERWQLPPEIPRCPVVQAWGGVAGLVVRFKVGQRVVVGVRDVDHDGADGGRDDVGSRRFDWSDAVVMGGVDVPASSLPESPADAVLTLGSGGVLYLPSPTASRALALAKEVRDQLADIATALAKHTHGGVTTGNGTSGFPAAAPYTAPTTAAISSDRIRTDS